VEPVKSRYELAWIHNITDIPQADWDALALPLKTPFLEWNWLHKMEASGSTTARTGWLPNHLILRRDRTLIAAAPLYVKSHSYGEFVFDHQWAELSERLGADYYPKLLGMSPFTPAEGYRFLVAPGEDVLEIAAMMVNAIDHFCIQNQLSGCNFLYVDPEWQEIFQQLGFSAWLHHSYIWSNKNYNSFEDYLQSFNANQRRNIKRERKAVIQAGLEFKIWQGETLNKQILGQMYRFYADTCDKFGWWGSKYLTRQFFELLYPDYCDRVLLFAAYTQQDLHHPVGMSFCLTKGDRLYGRYWGARDEIDCLHFDACYYQPIEWAIDHQIQVFDPGAGGRHKKRRGFPATPNYSLHRFYNPRLSQILRSHIDRINELEQQEIDAINQDLPFKQEPMQFEL
jgi:uncharacterized protein